MRESGAGGEVQQCAVRLATMVLAPRTLAGEGGEVWAGNMMVMADLAAPQAREIRLGPICRCAVVRNELSAVVDPVRIVGAMQDIPSRRFVPLKNRARSDTSADCRDRRTLALNHDRHGPTITLADDDDDLALAGALLS